MNRLQIFMLTTAVILLKHFTRGVTENKTGNSRQTKSSREIEAYSSISLDDEEFSVATIVKSRKFQTSLTPNSHKQKILSNKKLLKKGGKMNKMHKEKVPSENVHRFKGNNTRGPKPLNIRIKPGFTISLGKNTAFDDGKRKHHINKAQKQHQYKKQKKLKNLRKKKIHKKRFVIEKNYIYKIEDGNNQDIDDNLGKSYAFNLVTESSNPSNRDTKSSDVSYNDNFVVQKRNIQKIEDGKYNQGTNDGLGKSHYFNLVPAPSNPSNHDNKFGDGSNYGNFAVQKGNIQKIEDGKYNQGTNDGLGKPHYFNLVPAPSNVSKHDKKARDSSYYNGFVVQERNLYENENGNYNQYIDDSLGKSHSFVLSSTLSSTSNHDKSSDDSVYDSQLDKGKEIHENTIVSEEISTSYDFHTFTENLTTVPQEEMENYSLHKRDDNVNLNTPFMHPISISPYWMKTSKKEFSRNSPNSLYSPISENYFPHNTLYFPNKLNFNQISPYTMPYSLNKSNSENYFPYNTPYSPNKPESEKKFPYYALNSKENLSPQPLKYQTSAVPWIKKESLRSYRESNGNTEKNDYKSSLIPSIVTTRSHLNILASQQTYIKQRNLEFTTRRSKSKHEKSMDQLFIDENNSEDTVVGFDVHCDQLVNMICWMEREVGDVLTLAVKIDSSKKPNSFQVRWIRFYQEFDSKKSFSLEMLPGKLPWNMVSGSDSRELRLNPVTNTDIDPNFIVAKVFMLNKAKGKSTLFTLLKKLVFRIDIPIIDMGKIYAGEELSINIENFLSLPEKGNLLFDWRLETRPHHLQALPSNIKVSNSGRSVVLKELKKGRLGVLNCVIYSSSRIAVAKRRFNVLKIGENVKRRSTLTYVKDAKLTPELKQSLRCRRVIRKNRQDVLKKRLEAGTKPKSRKKRFKRTEPTKYDLDCGPLKRKLYSRWVRSVFGFFSTEDPKIMPLEKLFELSEDGDGTLDDVIPHEVHYVEPEVRYVAGTALGRPVNRFALVRNCTQNSDCGPNATCVMIQNEENATVQNTGYCSCRPEFYGDGFSCHKIPSSNHREKRLKRYSQKRADKELSVPQHLFYERPRSIARSPVTQPQEDESSVLPKVLAFEEEESFMLSDCIDDKDCSIHSSCVQPTNGHPYCKCRPGYRGNGIFCWEIIDYVPPEEQFLQEEEVDYGMPSTSPDMYMGRLASRTFSPEELEE